MNHHDRDANSIEREERLAARVVELEAQVAAMREEIEALRSERNYLRSRGGARVVHPPVTTIVPVYESTTVAPRPAPLTSPKRDW